MTSIVNTTRNGNYTFGGLTVVTGTPHCDVSAVVAGWSLIVIYESASERLRAINLYDGLAPFRGSQVILTPDGFRVPPANIDGRIAVFTLEGDPANSDQMNGIDEALRYNGSLLDDGINVTGSVPTIQQFDGTINTQGVSTSYGIDVDQYDISALLSPGQTSGTTTYSAGADLVLLMAQIVSATSDPAVDLVDNQDAHRHVRRRRHRHLHHHRVERGRHGARRQHRHGDRHVARGPDLQLRRAARAGPAARSARS